MVKRTGKFYGPIVELSRLQSELNRMFAAFGYRVVRTPTDGALQGQSQFKVPADVAAALPEVLLVSNTLPVEYCRADQALQTQIRASRKT